MFKGCGGGWRGEGGDGIIISDELGPHDNTRKGRALYTEVL